MYFKFFPKKSCMLIAPLFIALFMAQVASAQSNMPVVPLVLGDTTIVIPDSQRISSDRADWSVLLDDSWMCGSTNAGPRFELWKKNILLFAATSGLTFEAYCGRVKVRHYQQAELSDTDGVLIVFRDDLVYRDDHEDFTLGKITHAAWYDSSYDYSGSEVFGGIMPLHTRFPFGQLGSNNVAHIHNCIPLRIMTDIHSDCFGYIQVPVGDSLDSIRVVIRGSANNPLTAKIEYIDGDNGNQAFDLFIGVATTIAFAYVGAQFGEFIGIGEVGSIANAAFASGITTSLSAYGNGADPEDALLEGLRSAATAGTFAYVGDLLVDRFGDPQSLVGVAGAGCPNGDQCFYLKILNGFPPTKRLAELHDPFIDFTLKAANRAAESPGINVLRPVFDVTGDFVTTAYKAVTIPPFFVAGCAATAECVTAGIVIARADELENVYQPSP